MFTKTQVTVGRNMTTEAGTRWTSLRLRPIGAAQRTRSSGPAPETLTLIERARAVTIEAAKKQAAQVVAAATIVQVEAATVGRRNATIYSANPRIGRGVDKRANASRIFNAAAVIASAVEDLAAVASGVADDN